MSHGFGELRQRQPVPKRREKLTAAQRELQSAAQLRFVTETLRLDLGRCIGATAFGSGHECRKGDPLRAHHAIKEQTLRNLAWKLGLTFEERLEMCWDPGIAATVCDGLHVHHHDGTEFKIPLGWLAPRNVDWATDRSVLDLLLRQHPRDTDPPLFD